MIVSDSEEDSLPPTAEEIEEALEFMQFFREALERLNTEEKGIQNDR